MTKITKHQCPSCGGDLAVDNDKQMYRCMSCGSSYDYDYFREEKLHEMGETNLSRKEFGAAVDAYRLLLKKDPHDFTALRGLMLAAAYLKDFDGIARLGEAKHFSYDSQMVKEVIESASDKDREYFTEFGKLYADKKMLIDCYSEIESLHREYNRIESAIRLTDDTRYDYYIKVRGGSWPPKAYFIFVWCFTAFFLQLVLSVAGALSSSGTGGVAVFMAVFCGLIILISLGINFGYVYPRMKEIKEIDTTIKELYVESDLTKEKIKKCEASAEELAGKLRKDIHDFVKKDSLTEADSTKEQVSEISKIKKHQCPSCGGSLRIDSDKQMYHCTFCGSSYDYEYYKEDRIHEAGETFLSRGEFMATSDAYEFMLKKDPHDFIALRGLMLSAAHLTSMNELDQEKDKETFSYSPEMVSQAIESALEEDKEYFKELARVYSEKKKLVDHAGKIKALWGEKDKINNRIAQNNLTRNNYYIGGKEGTLNSPKSRFILFWAITALIMLYPVGFGIGIIESLNTDPASAITYLIFFIPGLLICTGLIVCNYIFNYSKIRKLKKIDKENAALYVEAGRMEEKIKDLEDESAKLLAGIRGSIHNFVRKDRIIMSGKTLQE